VRAIRRIAVVAVHVIPLTAVLAAAVWFALVLALDVDRPLVSTRTSAMAPTIRRGDLVLLRHAGPGDIRPGDIIAFDAPGERRIRRVVSRDQHGTSFRYVVKGDAHAEPDEGVVEDPAVNGVVDAHVRWLGFVVLGVTSASGRLVVGVTVAACVVAVAVLRRRRRARPYGVAMSITPADLRHQRFKMVRKGYDAAQVDRAMEDVADSLESLLHERHELADRVRALESEIARFREVEATLSQTLTLAERAAEELKAEAREEADRILAAARSQAALAAPTSAPAAPVPGGSAMPDPAFIELLGETRAIRSLLQALITSPPDGGSPFVPRQ
jgi:signal peptidase I